MINRKTVDRLPPEIEVPEAESLDVGGDLRNVENYERPALTEENFAKLCCKVTEMRERRQKTLDDLERRLVEIENDLDIQAVNRIISTLKTEALELEPIKP